MVFGFFSRSKTNLAASTASEVDLPPPGDSKSETAPPVQLRTPSPSEAASTTNALAELALAQAPEGPSIPAGDAESLAALISSVPAKTLHTYTLQHLPNSPAHILTSLSHFYSQLTPPPLQHCVRCHKDYAEDDNSDRSCVIAHDDDSAEVERVGVRNKGAARAGAGGFETIWNCCGRTVEGDGDQGPPDGWCFEGRHTTDAKRARFRADSKPNDPKLVRCKDLNCHGIRRPITSTDAATPYERIADSYSVRRKRKVREMKEKDVKKKDPVAAASEEEEGSGEEGDEEAEGEDQAKAGKGAGRGKKGRGRPSLTAKDKGKGKAIEDDSMDVDEEQHPAPKPAPKRKPRASGASTLKSDEDGSVAGSEASARKGRKPRTSTGKARGKKRMEEVKAADGEQASDGEEGERKRRRVA